LAFGFQRSRQKPIKNYAPQANDANEEAKPKKKNKNKNRNEKKLYAIEQSGAASVQRGGQERTEEAWPQIQIQIQHPRTTRPG